MTISKLSAEQLLSGLKNLVRQEREILNQVLSHIHEVQSRKLYVELGYTSLFDFCVRELGYSSDQAFRRISAMRLIQTMPSAQKKIQSGNLSLSNAAELYKYVRTLKQNHPGIDENNVGKIQKSMDSSNSAEPESIGKLLDFACQNSKQALQQKILQVAEHSGNVRYVPREFQKPVTSTLTEIKITLPNTTVQKLKSLHQFYSNTLKEAGTSKLVEFLIEQAFEKVERQKQDKDIKANSESKPPTFDVSAIAQDSALSGKVGAQQKNGKRLLLQSKNPRYIPTKLKRMIAQRDQYQCQYPGCAAKHYLHFDHINPIALGGRSTENNLRLLCAAHNQFEAQRVLGNKMDD